MDWTVLLRFLLAVAIGGLIGYEREQRKKKKAVGGAGLRTHMLVCLGAALFTYVSASISPADPARIAAGIVTGIGFIGAGTIIATRGKVRGITTAASIWLVGGLGMAVAFGFYLAATIVTLLALVILELWRIEAKK